MAAAAYWLDSSHGNGFWEYATAVARFVESSKRPFLPVPIWSAASWRVQLTYNRGKLTTAAL